MNAITDLQSADLALEYIPLTSIRVSSTAVQTLRRDNYSQVKLLELAANIKENGVLQPILVRPVVFDTDLTVKFEIVAGERRYLAADRAGLAHIPAVIRDLDTIQTLQAQLVENIAREQLSAIEEATGFREMLDKGKLLTPEKVGERIGKSRSYVYARLKLLDLIPEARKALADGTLDASKGLILARIKGEKVQARALSLITETGTYMSYRRLMEKLRDDFMIPITQAPWLPDRDTLHLPKSGDPVQMCATCPTRSCNDPELQDEIEGADVCIDRACFEIKTKLHWTRVRKEYEAQGRQIITGDAVKDLVDTRGGYMGSSVHNGFVRLDAECNSIEFNEPEPKPKKGQTEDDLENDPDWQAWAQRREDFEAPDLASIVGELPDTQLVQTSKGLVPVAPVATVVKALKAKGIEIPYQLKPAQIRDHSKPETEEDRQRAAAERAKEEEREKVETEFRARLLTQIHAKWKPPLKRDDLAQIADCLLDGVCPDDFDALYPSDGPLDISKMKEADLARVMLIFVLAINSEYLGNKPTALLAAAARLKIDAKKIRAEVVKDLRPVSAATEAEPAAAAKKAKKKGAKK